MNNKVILITGVNSKLGSIVSKKILQKGHVVVGCSRKKPEQFDGHWIPLDLTSKESIDKLVKLVVKKHGKIDVVIHIAGVSSSGSMVEPKSIDEFENMFRVNVLGQYILNNQILEVCKSCETRIISITSLCGIAPVPNFGIYCSTKSALEAMNAIYNMDYAKTQVKFTSIAPGAIEFESDKKVVSHHTLRDRFPLLGLIFPFVTPEKIADKIDSLINSDGNPVRIIMGRDAQLINLLYRFLPISIYSRLFKILNK